MSSLQTFDHSTDAEACLSSRGLPVVQRPACRPEACLSSRGLPVVQRPACRPEAHLSSRGPPVVQRPTCRPEAHLSSRGPPVVQRPTCRPEAHLSSRGPPVVQRPTCHQRPTYHPEGVIPEGEWPAILRKQASGRIMEVMMYLDLTLPYQSIKSNLLEYLVTHQSKSQAEDVDLKAWGQSVTMNFLAPIVRNIQRLSKYQSSQKDFVKKLFLGVLTLHYSAEVCHGLQEKDTQTVYQLVAELEASWESRSFTAKSRMLQDKIIT